MPRHRRGWGVREQVEGKMRQTPLSTSLLEPAVLMLISADPSHGYSLLTDLAELGLGNIHPSVVYRTLREMEELGWIRSEWNSDQTQGPARRIYFLAEDGAHILNNWKQELAKARQIIDDLHAQSNGRKE